MGFLGRVVVTPRARHTPEKTDRRVELCRFSRFAELIPRRRSFPRFSESWPRTRPLRFLERFVVTPRARHTPEKTDRRVELCRFSRFAELIPRRRIGLSRFSRFVSKSWQNDAPGRSFVYMHKWSLPSSSPSFPSLSLRRPGPGRAGPGRADQLPALGRASERDRRQGFGAHDRAGLRHATGGRASERDQASAHTTGPGFGTPLAQLIPRRRIRTLSSFSSISPTITLLRSPNASSPHLASVSLLLPPFTHRSARNSVDKNVDRHLRFPNWSPVDGSDFGVVFLDFSNYHPVKVAKCLVTSSS